MPLNAPPPIYVHPAQVPLFVRVVFPTGVTHQTDTPEHMEDYLRELYSAFHVFWDNQHFREVMAQRALEESWGDLELDTDGTSRDFLCELERAGFFIVGFHFEDKETVNHDPWSQ